MSTMDFQPPPPLLPQPDLVSSATSTTNNNNDNLNMAENCSSGFQSNNSSVWSPATPCSSTPFTMQTTTFNDYIPQACLVPPPPSPPQSAPIHISHQFSQPPPNNAVEVVEEFEKIMANETDKVVLTNSLCLLYTFSIDLHRGIEYCKAISASQKILHQLYFVLTDPMFKEANLILCYATGNLTNISKYVDGRFAILNFNGSYSYQHTNGYSMGVNVLFHSLQSRDENVVIFAITAIHNLLLDRTDMIQENARQQIKHGISHIVQLLNHQYLKHNYEFKVIVLDCLQILAYGNSENKLAIQYSDGPRLILNTIEEDTTVNKEAVIETASRVLKSLSNCPENKKDIVNLGGVRTLIYCVIQYNNEILENCLWTLRNLSDVINNSNQVDFDDIQSLVVRLLEVLSNSREPCTIQCALGVLYNLTCNNVSIKQFICDNGGIELLLKPIVGIASYSREAFEIVETAVDALCSLMNPNQDPELVYKRARVINEFVIPEDIINRAPGKLANAIKKLRQLTEVALRYRFKQSLEDRELV